MLPPWCARAPQAPMPGGREGTPISANLPRFCPPPFAESGLRILHVTLDLSICMRAERYVALQL